MAGAVLGRALFNPRLLSGGACGLTGGDSNYASDNHGRAIIINPEEPVRKIIQYKTVKGSKYIINLDKEVNALIAKGFQPFGSPYVFQDIELFACQAMVRYEDAPAAGGGM